MIKNATKKLVRAFRSEQVIYVTDRNFFTDSKREKNPIKKKTHTHTFIVKPNTICLYYYHINDK